MAKRQPMISESCINALSLRIKEFALAIHNYGVEKLYLDLKSQGITSSSYTFEAYKSDFRHMKSDQNGFLLKPALIGPICELLHFPASALFGGPISKDEQTREMVKSAVDESLKAVAKKNTVSNKRIHNDKLFLRARKVYDIIQFMINTNYSSAEPIKQLFIWYSSKDKFWDHEKEVRIKIILENILNGCKKHHYTLNPYANIRSTFGVVEAGLIYDDFLNQCLIVAYQLSCIESLYAVHQKSKIIRVRGKTGESDIIQSSKIRFNISSENNDSDIFAVELSRFCKSFDLFINKNYTEHEEIKRLSTTLKTISKYFQELISFLFTPNQKDYHPQSQSGTSPIHYFTQAKKVIMNNFELVVTDSQINLLRENIRLIDCQNYTGFLLNPLDQSEKQYNGLNELTQDELIDNDIRMDSKLD
jgi:hypothetical protein